MEVHFEAQWASMVVLLSNVEDSTKNLQDRMGKEVIASIAESSKFKKNDTSRQKRKWKSPAKKKSTNTRRSRRHRRTRSSDENFVHTIKDSESTDSDTHGSSNSSRRRRLVEITPSDSCFKRVLFYKTYSFQNKDHRVSSNAWKKVGTWTKRMAVAIPKTFDGTDPLSLLQFWANIKMAADINGISEGLHG